VRVRLGHLSLRLARRRNADHPKAHAAGAAPLRGPGRSARNCSTPMSSLNILFVEEEEESEQERLTYPPGTTSPPRDYPAYFPPFLGQNGRA
jgi:hypothetical protein